MILLAPSLGILQAFRFGASDRDHVARLLHWAEFAPNARVVDLGAGDGIIAQHMAALRPDLQFCLVDQKPPTCTQALAQMLRHQADIANVPKPDAAFDAVLCCYAMGYVSATTIWREMARLVPPAGVVFVVDMVPNDTTQASVELFGYQVRSRALVEAAAIEAGLGLDLYIEPYDPGDWGRAVFSGAFDVFFGDFHPAIWRFSGPKPKVKANSRANPAPNACAIGW